MANQERIEELESIIFEKSEAYETLISYIESELAKVETAVRNIREVFEARFEMKP